MTGVVIWSGGNFPPRINAHQEFAAGYPGFSISPIQFKSSRNAVTTDAKSGNDQNLVTALPFPRRYQETPGLSSDVLSSAIVL